jgi:hypothetical protein
MGLTNCIPLGVVFKLRPYVGEAKIRFQRNMVKDYAKRGVVWSFGPGAVWRSAPTATLRWA